MNEFRPIGWDICASYRCEDFQVQSDAYGNEIINGIVTGDINEQCSSIGVIGTRRDTCGYCEGATLSPTSASISYPSLFLFLEPR